MRKWFVAFLFLATPAWAQEHATAYQALRTVGQKLNRELVNHVVSVSGTKGDSQPAIWTLLLDDTHARGGVREVEVSNGEILSERTPLRATVENSLGAVIDTGKLNLDSSGAYTVARQTAESSHVHFATVDYSLRVDQRRNPVWTLALEREDGTSAGKISIGANHGTITRTEGLFRGPDQVASTGDEPEAPAGDDDHDQNVVKRRIKQAFHTARDDVKQTFFKVRRSFVDFFQDK
jgi:hypothetical protein